MHLRAVSLAVDFCTASIAMTTSQRTLIMPQQTCNRRVSEALGDAWYFTRAPKTHKHDVIAKSQSHLKSMREIEVELRSRLPCSTKDP